MNNVERYYGKNKGARVTIAIKPGIGKECKFMASCKFEKENNPHSLGNNTAISSTEIINLSGDNKEDLINRCKNEASKKVENIEWE